MYSFKGFIWVVVTKYQEAHSVTPLAHVEKRMRVKLKNIILVILLLIALQILFGGAISEPASHPAVVQGS
jgi:hypothetical protein